VDSRHPAAIDAAHPGRDPEQLAEAARLRARLRKALGALPRSYRIVLFLRDMEGLSTREVAQVVGISENNVKTRLRRARAALIKGGVRPRPVENSGAN
jgi:RNA polymerase sigma factor (sigma-70 family)